MSNTMPELSVVVPVKNEEENIIPLISEICAALDNKVEFEIVYVDDGSDDDTPSKLQEARGRFPRLRILRHEESCGQSQAVATGVKYARAPLIATLDGDGQNDPADIPSMLDVMAKAEDKDKLLVAGHRHKRKDSSLKKVTSKCANFIRKALLHDDTPDTGCGCKLFSRVAFLDMPRFNHMHRYLPALMIRRGGKVISVHVNHRFRERGVSKYGFWNRAIVSVYDLIGVIWLIRRKSNPVVIEEE
ncbi:MAG: glycosyltransferase family 2 protein [Alphaproteobacteria bacterium]|nr:glycosyltransferase family 2 protein [Alphaproteobacteria bacterium]